MNDMTEVHEGQEVEVRAREMGWIPKEDFKGDLTRWVSAQEYVERGETVLPILQATNKKLREELAAQRARLEELAAARAQDAETVKELQAAAVDMAKLQHRRALESLKAKKAEALGESDHAAVVEIDEAIAELKAKEPAAAKVAPASAPANSPVDVTAPYFRQFKEDNPWLDKDYSKTAWAVGKTKELADEGLRGKALVERLQEEYNEIWAPRRTADKLEGSRGGAGRESGRASGNGRSWNDIPKEDQEVCLKRAPTLVGEGKAHKTLDSWKKSFAEQYFAM
jgi:hypothetical protein